MAQYTTVRGRKHIAPRYFTLHACEEEHTGDEKRQSNDGSVVDAMQRLQNARPARQQRCPPQSVTRGMCCAEGEIERDAPICQVGKVAEGLTGMVVEMVLRELVYYGEKESHKGVQGDEGAIDDEGEWREKPRCCEAVCRVKWLLLARRGPSQRNHGRYSHPARSEMVENGERKKKSKGKGMEEIRREGATTSDETV